MKRAVWLLGGAAVAAGAIYYGLQFGANRGGGAALDAALAHLPPGFTATHGPVTLDPLGGTARIAQFALAHNGAVVLTADELAASNIGTLDDSGTPKRIGHVTLRNVQAGSYHVGQADIDGLGAATLRQVLDTTAYPGGKPAFTDKRPVADTIALKDASFSQTSDVRQAKGPPVKTTVVARFAAITVDGVRMAQLDAAPDYGAKPAVLAAAFSLAAATKSSQADNGTIEATGAQHVIVTIAHGENGAVDGGRGDHVSITGIEGHGDQPGKLTIDSITARDIDSSALYRLLPEMQAHPDKVGARVFGAMHIGRFDLNNLRADFQGPLVTLDKMRLVAQAGDAPGTFTLHDMEVRTAGRPIDAKSRAQLQTFGMEDFRAEFEEAANFDSATHRLTLQKADLDMAGLGSLHLGAVVDNMPDLSADESSAATQAAVLQAALRSAIIQFTNHSLFGRALKVAAVLQHTTPDKLQAMLYVSTMGLHAVLPNQPDAAEQVGAFLQGQHGLSITFNPPQPVSVAQLQSAPPALRASLLGARVSGN